MFAKIRWLSLLLLPVTAAAQSYYGVMDLSTLGGSYSEARGINNRNEIVGLSANTSGKVHGFIWRNGIISDLGVLPGGDTSEAHAINTDGIVAGRGNGGEAGFSGIRWIGGVPEGLGTSVASNSAAYAINAGGTIVGDARLLVPPYYSFLQNRAVQWTAGVPAIIGPQPAFGPVFSFAYGINTAGNVVGSASTPDTGGQPHAAIFGPPLRDLHSAALGLDKSQARAVNDLGTVVGFAWSHPTAMLDPQAFIWTETNGTARLLPALPGLPWSAAYGLNNRGDAVGYGSGGAPVPLLWSSNTAIELQSRIPANSGWDLDIAYGINDSGLIVGVGNHLGQTRGFLLYPTNLFQLLFGTAKIEARDCAGTPTVKAVAGAAIKLNSARGSTVATVGTQHTDSEGRYAFLVPQVADTLYALTLTLADKNGHITLFDHAYDTNHPAWLRTPLFTLDASGRADIQMLINVDAPEVRPPPGTAPSSAFMNWTSYYLNNAWFIPAQRPVESTVDGSASNTSARHFAHLAMFYVLMLEAADFAGNVLQQPMPLVPVFLNDPAANGHGKFFSSRSGTIHIEPSESLFNSSYGDPADSLRHEYGHAVLHWSPIVGVDKSPPLDLVDINHHGIQNLTTADSWDEGFATYYAAAVSAWKGEGSPERVMFRLPVDLVWDEPRIDNPSRPGRQMSDYGDPVHLLAEEFAIASILWQVHASNGVQTLWATLRRNVPVLNDLKAVFDDFKGEPLITTALAGMTLNIPTTGASVSGLDCLFVERGFYYDVNGDGRFDAGEEIGVTRSIRTGGRRTTPPVLPGGEALLHVTAATPGAAITAAVFRVRIEYDPPRQARSYEYLRLATGSQPFRLPLLLPAVPSRALVTAFVPGSPALAESAPLVVSNHFLLARVDPSQPGGPPDVLLEHTFELDAVAGYDLVVGTTAAVTAGGEVPHIAITASISNRGSLTANNVVVAHTLPPGAANVSVSASAGMPLVSTTNVMLSLGTVASGDSVNLAIEFDRAPGVMLNRTEVTASGNDANPSDNVVVLTTRAIMPPALVLASSSSSGLHIAFATRPDCTYILERTDTLEPSEWTVLAVLPGTGIERMIDLPITANPVAFYRLRIQ